MIASFKNKKSTLLAYVGMAVMIVAVAVKAATSSVIAAAAIHIAGLACFFIIEGIEKTPDSESGLSFKRFFSDLKKPGVLLLILFLLVLSPVEMLLSKAVFGSAYIDHVLGRVNVPGLDQLPLLLFNQIVSVLGEEIEFRAFFVGKGMKRFSFWPVAVAGAVLFAAAHYTAGAAGIVAWDLGGIFIDAILFAILYRRTGNCLISFIPHFLNNMIGFFLVPVLFG
ncbi:MAG: CPBP family intramembrane metalloprotease [Oscillospiraceae bacterium]|nr:CPBP family intramembrane metalloprotease [Oscillospiraceae bacterium]